jgi:hypothetical protein
MVYRKEMSAGIDLLKKQVPGASHLNRPEVIMAAVKYIAFLEKKNQKMEDEKSKMTSSIPLCDSTERSSTEDSSNAPGI